MVMKTRVTACVIAAATVTTAAMAGVTPLQPTAGDPLDGLTADELELFWAGRDAFEMNLSVEDGLGPVFNQTSCASCHDNPIGGPGSQSVVRFGTLGKGGFDPLEIFGGSLLQSQTIAVECQETLPPEATVVAFRVTPGALGFGLIEAIPDDQLMELVNAPPAGISGVAHMVPLLEDDEAPLRVGRFGWKAQLATMLSFSADASLMEMGLTNRIIGSENDPNGIREPLLVDCDTVPDPEDGPDEDGFDFIDRVTHFQRYLAAPPQTPKSGMAGEAVFANIGCADCHRPSFTTADDPGLEDAIRNKEIRPYADFLLHDMGLLGDGIAQGAASTQEIRTPPLWGLRTRDPLLHDGTVGGGTFEERVTMAIEAHGPFGEGAASAAAFAALSAGEKNDLFAFLDSLGRREFDHTGDDIVDLDDFVIFMTCLGQSRVSPDDICAVSDVDQDGDVDLDDFDSFVDAYDAAMTDCNCNDTADIIDVATGASLDLDGDGVPDECGGFCAGDVDCSGDVGPADLSVLLASWGVCPEDGFCPADLNADGEVGPADLAALLSAWGGCE